MYSAFLAVTSAQAGLFDAFKTKDKDYDHDVMACWNAVVGSISEKNRKMKYFDIDHQGPNPKTGYRSVFFQHKYGDSRGCIIESNGSINRIIGLP